MATKPPLIAVTGSIGSGKSAVCAFLHARFSFPLLSADSICRELLEKDREGWSGFVAELGTGYLDADGNVDRKKMRKIVFADLELRKRLEAILHPLARKEMLGRASMLLRQGVAVLAEVPLLIEAGWQSDFDKTVVVYAELNARLARLCKRDCISRREAEAMLESQLPDYRKIMASDHVIDNSGTWANTLAQLLHFGSLYAHFP